MNEKLSDILDSKTKEIIWKYGRNQKSLHKLLSLHKTNIFLGALERYFLAVGPLNVIEDMEMLMKVGKRYGVSPLQTFARVYLLTGQMSSEFNNSARRVMLYIKIKAFILWALIVWLIISTYLLWIK